MARHINLLFAGVLSVSLLGCSQQPSIQNSTTAVVEMDENRFWQIIEQSREGLNPDEEQDIQCQNLRHILSGLTYEEVVAFDRRFLLLFIKANTWVLADGLHHFGSGGDDSFMDFRYWLISQGRDRFYAAIENPDLFLSKCVASDEFVFFEEFGSIRNEFLFDDTSHVDDLIPIGAPSTKGLPENATDENLSERYPLITRAQKKHEENHR